MARVACAFRRVRAMLSVVEEQKKRCIALLAVGDLLACRRVKANLPIALVVEDELVAKLVPFRHLVAVRDTVWRTAIDRLVVVEDKQMRLRIVRRDIVRMLLRPDDAFVSLRRRIPDVVRFDPRPYLDVFWHLCRSEPRLLLVEVGEDWFKIGRQRDDFFQSYSEPGKVGARGSKLYAILNAGHHGVQLTQDEWRRLILFMDSNGAYLAHDYEPQMQLEGQVVEPVLQ